MKSKPLSGVLTAVACLAASVSGEILKAEAVVAEAVTAKPAMVPEAVAEGEVVPDEGEGSQLNERARAGEEEKDLMADDVGVPEEGELAVRLQIFLDQKLFGPGFIDGKPGAFTTRAVHAYNRSVGRNPGDWAALVKEADETLGETYATAIVPEVAKEWVTPKLPYKYSQQADAKRLGYRSYLEFMAERYHTSETFLEEINGESVTSALVPHGSLMVPNVEPFRIELLKEGRTHHEDDTLSGRHVIIDTQGKNLFVYAEGESPVLPNGAVVISESDHVPQKLLAMFPITPGKVQFIHHGTWAVANCYELPSWRYDPQFLETGTRSKDKSAVKQLAPGPNLPVGILWCGLTKSGIGIHGSSSPRTIGRSRSAGCIRLSNWDAARFPELVRPGAAVELR